MTNIVPMLSTALDLLLVVLGFGMIIFIHELGHFVAAKWAGIRVLAFAIGFGPAALSWRKGMGLRRGSSEPEYRRLMAAQASANPTPGRSVAPGSIGSTEYRLNYLPLGGYVKMLGQDDINPGAVSSAADSYQNCPVWKRMVVISAGVVMNVIAAAVLFIAVFMTGLKTEPPVVGYVAPGMPASQAVPTGAAGVTQPGLKTGDVITSINGRRPNSFNDLVMASAMSRKGEPMRVEVERPGVARPIDFEIRPKASEQSRLLEIGVTPSLTATLVSDKNEAVNAQIRALLENAGLKGVDPGMTLIRIGSDTQIRGAGDLVAAVEASGGRPVEAEFLGKEGRHAVVSIQPRAAMQTGRVQLPTGKQVQVNHLLGLSPVMRVNPNPNGDEGQQGLRGGDIFARVGMVEYPGLAAGIAEIQRNKGKSIRVDVLRKGADGALRRVRIEPDPEVKNKGDGQIGFSPGDTADESTLVALPPAGIIDDKRGGDAAAPPAETIIDRPGMRIVSVGGTAVWNFSEIRAALREATRGALESGAERARVTLVLEPPGLEIGDGTAPLETVQWELSRADVNALHALGWRSPVDLGFFELEEFTLVAQGPNVAARSADAVRMGIAETNRVMMMTYATFARLYEGTVKVEHLKGPIGIAHIGTRIAERGTIWLLFFMALISINLAVINFLPLPIVDGGQFIFLILEKIRGRPLSIEIQNIATVAGLVLIGTMFVVVTFHDIVNLFTG